MDGCYGTLIGSHRWWPWATLKGGRKGSYFSGSSSLRCAAGPSGEAYDIRANLPVSWRGDTPSPFLISIDTFRVSFSARLSLNPTSVNNATCRSKLNYMELECNNIICRHWQFTAFDGDIQCRWSDQWAVSLRVHEITVTYSDRVIQSSCKALGNVFVTWNICWNSIVQ